MSEQQIWANGRLHLLILDASDREFEEFGWGDEKMVSCPSCDTGITEGMDHCPECRAYVVWVNSKIWKNRYYSPVKAKVEKVERFFATDAEAVALEALYAACYGKRVGEMPPEQLPIEWPSGTVLKLRALRSAGEIPDSDSPQWLDFVAFIEKKAQQAVAKQGDRGGKLFHAGSANWLIGAILGRLGQRAAADANGAFVRQRVTVKREAEEPAVISKGGFLS